MTLTDLHFHHTPTTNTTSWALPHPPPGQPAPSRALHLLTLVTAHPLSLKYLSFLTTECPPSPAVTENLLPPTLESRFPTSGPWHQPNQAPYLLATLDSRIKQRNPPATQTGAKPDERKVPATADPGQGSPVPNSPSIVTPAQVLPSLPQRLRSPSLGSCPLHPHRMTSPPPSQRK